MSNKIIIKTKQYDVDGNMDTIELKAYGQIIEKNGSIYIKYNQKEEDMDCLLYTSPSPRDGLLSRMPSSA